MKLLILNEAILAAGELTETDTKIQSADAIYPKHVIEGYQIIEAELPGDYAPGKYTYNGGFVRVPEPVPVIPVPEAVTMRQARLALLAAGLLDDVNTLIASIGPAAAITWEFATEVQRNNELIAAVQEQQALTEDQIDDLFIVAATL